MMSADNPIWQLAESYLRERLSGPERQELEQRQQQDPAFAAQFDECLQLLRALEASSRNRKMRASLRQIHQQTIAAPAKEASAPRSIPLKKHYWQVAGVAASMAFLFSLVYNYGLHQKVRTNASIYQELNNIKTKQREQDRTINIIRDSLSENKAPAAEVFSTGTAFALTNDGYMVTSCHLVKNADSVYIRTRSNQFLKAYVSAFNDKTDIAILRIEHRDFRFSKTDLPYTFGTVQAPLGSRVYTIGFPQDAIVYNEGYISAESGYSGDSNQYRMDLNTSAGQSGSPIVDQSGSLIAMVSGHEKDAQSNTYAVRTAAMLDLLHTLPLHLSLPKRNHLARLSRTQQVSALQEYTCLVQVYKK